MTEPTEPSDVVLLLSQLLEAKESRDRWREEALAHAEELAKVRHERDQIERFIHALILGDSAAQWDVLSAEQHQQLNTVIRELRAGSFEEAADVVRTFRQTRGAGPGIDAWNGACDMIENRLRERALEEIHGH